MIKDASKVQDENRQCAVRQTRVFRLAFAGRDDERPPIPNTLPRKAVERTIHTTRLVQPTDKVTSVCRTSFIDLGSFLLISYRSST
jgi:hypothetical protein